MDLIINIICYCIKIIHISLFDYTEQKPAYCFEKPSTDVCSLPTSEYLYNSTLEMCVLFSFG